MAGASAAGRLEPQMPLYAANPLVELANQDAVAEHA
jgi:hypothetical protein